MHADCAPPRGSWLVRWFKGSAAAVALLTASWQAAWLPAAEPEATPISMIHAAKGFNVELLYSVPKGEQGSWVNMCTDPKGRLIVSDQYGPLYRITPAAAGSKDAAKIEQIPADIGEAQGLLWAFDSLYVMVNRGKKYASGLYRVRDTDGDDMLDQVETLKILDGGAEHGPHALILAPDGNSIYVVCGNRTRLPELTASRVPEIWDEDLLLPRTYGRGFMKGTPAPGGYICRIDPDAKQWELVAVGFRNEYDAAFNADGELFAYDADMEWDVNTPWYRPTRICHATSGAEFGWRNGAGKWPSYYPDSLPSAVDIGPGSPTGVCFGYGARFPAKYQRAYFAADWSYGKLYAVHLEPDGSTYQGKAEEFITGTPLPLTDVVINPHDGAMYFTIGGRRVQSGLYRVTYTGEESTEPAELKHAAGSKPRALRHKLEALHVGDHPTAVKQAWPELGNEDRFIRFAARVAIEHRPVAEWQQQALDAPPTQLGLTALLALVRMHERKQKGTGDDIDTPAPEYPLTDTARHPLLPKVLAAAARFRWGELSAQQKIELLRIYALAFVRLSPPDEQIRQRLIAQFEPRFPDKSQPVNSELAQLLVYLQSPSAARKIVARLEQAPTQEEQINYAKTLRHLRTGWTPEAREAYFTWFVKAGGFRGGASFSLFVEHIKADAVAQLSPDEKQSLAEILNAKPPEDVNPIALEPRPLVKEWKLSELIPLFEQDLKDRDFEQGRTMFAAAKCFACHRFDQQGGALGPDLTTLSKRFNRRDILESVVDPAKEVSSQYAALQITTVDGRSIVGRIVNLAGEDLKINTNMLDPNAQVSVKRADIEEMFPSKISMMPAGLLNTLHKEEILDLMAYLLSGGDRNSPMFKQGGE